MDERVRREVESVLGPLTEDDRGRYATLNEIEDDTAAGLRRLPLRSAAAALRFLVDRRSRRFVELFLADVVAGGARAGDWHRGRIIVPSLSVHDQLTRDRPDVLAAVGPTFDRFLPPDRAAWDAGVSWVGAPCRPDPGFTYLDVDEAVTDGADLTPRPTAPVSSPEITVRRWHAGRLARVVGLDRRASLTDADVCLAVGVRGLDDLSDDGRIALAALRAEVELTGGAIGDGVYGFVGPDALYRTPSPGRR